MAPQKRVTGRKRMFGDLKNEGTSRDSQAFHLDKNISRRSYFFEHLQEEGTSVDLQTCQGENSNVETTVDPCHFQDEYLETSEQSLPDNENVIGNCRQLLYV